MFLIPVQEQIINCLDVIKIHIHKKALQISVISDQNVDKKCLFRIIVMLDIYKALLNHRGGYNSLVIPMSCNATSWYMYTNLSLPIHSGHWFGLCGLSQLGSDSTECN